MLHGHGVLVLPSCPGDLRSVRAYAAAGGRALRQYESAAGWVVDLRGNSGGSMWPMLAVALPLLGGDGVIGAFVTRDGARTLSLSGPVAVLTDARTASSAEAVAVAFRGVPGARSYGAATRGFSTGNQTVRLPDGALLVITSCRFADRSGGAHGGPLPPDVPAADAFAAALAGLGRH
jgi:C-terminal processing protease CtpA/Prc